MNCGVRQCKTVEASKTDRDCYVGGVEMTPDVIKIKISLLSLSLSLTIKHAAPLQSVPTDNCGRPTSHYDGSVGNIITVKFSEEINQFFKRVILPLPRRSTSTKPRLGLLLWFYSRPDLTG